MVDVPTTLVESKKSYDAGAGSVILPVPLLGTHTTRGQLMKFFFLFFSGRDVGVPKGGSAIRNIYSMVACHVVNFRCRQGAAEQRRGRRLRMTTSRRSRYKTLLPYERHTAIDRKIPNSTKTFLCILRTKLILMG